METRANYLIVGLFTIVTVLAAFAFVYWTAGGGDRGEMTDLRIRIPGSASGLSRGSAVLFNGVRVGEIRRVFIDVTDPDAAIADARIDRRTPVTQSTQVDVGLAGLTGQANIEMRGSRAGEESLLDLAAQQGTVAEVTANPSAVTNLLESAQSIFRRADSVLGDFEGFVADVRGPLTESARNAQAFSEALGRNAEGIDTFLASVSQMSETLAGVSDQLGSTLEAGEQLIRAVDPDRVNQVVTNVENFTRQIDQAAGQIEGIMNGLEQAVGSLVQLADNAGETLGHVDRVVASVDPDSVAAVVRNFENASQTIDTVATDVAQLASSVGARSGDIDRIISDAQQLADRLNRASEGVEGVIARVDGILASDDIEGAIADARGAIESYRLLGERLIGSTDRVDQLIAAVDPATVENMMRNFESASVTAERVATDVAGLTDTFSARSGDIDRIISDAQQLADRLNRSSERVESVVARVDGILASEDIEGAIADARGAIESYRLLGERLIGSTDRVDQLIAAVDPATVETMMRNFESASTTADRIATDVAGLTDTFSARSEDIDRIISDAQQLADRLNRSSERVESVVARVDNVLASEDIEGVVGDARETLQSYRQLAERLNSSAERVDQVLVSLDELIGSGEAEGVMSEASLTLQAYRELAERLAESSGRLDSVLTRADDLLGSEEIGAIVREANETLRVFRQTAENLNARVASVTGGLERFTNQGLRDAEALIRDSRRSINRIEEAISAFERNPQRILSGGEGSVRQFDGRTRR